ncbi:MAG: hypothetical protein SWE60_26520 [Thermodesulfobacteriota bacterium]|nr:hypothetical protein [Thermodesulfobacteriota bacterium]
MKQLKKDLQAVSKELKALAKKTEKMMKAVQKLDKAQAVKKPKAKAKTKTKTVRKPATKKARAVTATDAVLKLIKRTKKGIDAPSLIKKTGFDERKVRNILFRAFKQGKIKRAGRGNYVAA